MNLRRMSSLILVTVLLLTLPVTVGFMAPTESGSNVEICHFPNEKGIGNILEVGRSAVPSHIAHGDCRNFRTNDDHPGQCLCRS